MQNTKKRILMVVAPENFRDIEYIVPAAFFKQNNMEVITTSSAKESVGRFGYQLQHTFLIDEINGNSYDALFIVGGIGCLQFKEHEALKRLCLEFVEQQKPLAAICAAPQLLLHWGILTGRNCTGFNDADQTFEKLAHMHKAHPLIEEAVVVSDFIVTGNGPAASDVMAQKFIEIVHQRE
jgi:putative intracellular protease/amidase